MGYSLMAFTVNVYGGFKELQKAIEEYLRENRSDFKKKTYGKIIFYKIGFSKKITLIYYRSEGCGEIRGPKDIVNDMASYLAKKGFRVLGVSKAVAESTIVSSVIAGKKSYLDTIADLIIEAQILKKKMKLSKRLLYIDLFLAATVFTLAMVSSINLEAILAFTLILLILLCIPYPVSRISLKEGFFIPIRYISYRDSFENLLKEIDFRVMLLPSREKEYIKNMIVEKGLREK